MADDRTDDLITTRDKYALDLYKMVAADEGLTLREFLLKYKLARKVEKKT